MRAALRASLLGRCDPEGGLLLRGRDPSLSLLEEGLHLSSRLCLSLCPSGGYRMLGEAHGPRDLLGGRLLLGLLALLDGLHSARQRFQRAAEGFRVLRRLGRSVGTTLLLQDTHARGEVAFGHRLPSGTATQAAC